MTEGSQESQESQESRLISRKSNSNTMASTDGPLIHDEKLPFIPGNEKPATEEEEGERGCTFENAGSGFGDDFGSLFHSPYMKKTVILMTIWFGTMFVTFGHIHYVLTCDRISYERDFHSKKFLTSNYTYENISFEKTIINQDFSFTRFMNCTFDQTFMRYVQFKNCTFRDTKFHGVKTANIKFVHSFLTNVKFIDTDITGKDFIDCTSDNTEFDSLNTGCDREFDISLFYHVHLGLVYPVFIIPIVVYYAADQCRPVLISTIALSLATTMCFLVSVFLGGAISWIVGILQGLIMTVLVALTAQAFKMYNTFQRFAVSGLCFCSSILGALVGLWVFSALPMADNYIVSVVSVVVLAAPLILSTFLQDATVAM